MVQKPTNNGQSPLQTIIDISIKLQGSEEINIRITEDPDC